MKLWKCHYMVDTGYSVMEMIDYVWSTSKLTPNEIGHYWKTLFPSYVISEESCHEIEHVDGMNLDARMIASYNK